LDKFQQFGSGKTLRQLASERFDNGIDLVGTPDEVAELVVWLSSDASSFCTGSEFVIDGGFLAGPLLRG
ncbi:MAG: SDR family oxidoreductase, partial [Actinobacteria bacterium]|nr:SDR family oxidoreductase [Actinomycetota bacterium]